MKTKSLVVLLAGLTLGSAGAALAGPPSSYFTSKREAQPSGQSDTARPARYNCAPCPSTDASPMASCKEGNRVTCQWCQRFMRTRHVGAGKAATPVREAVYVSPRGTPCVFVALDPERQ